MWWITGVPFGATESWEHSKLVKLGWSENHFEHSENSPSWVETSLKMCVQIPLMCFFFFFLCRVTVQGQALRWTSEMAMLWPTPTWAPLRMVSNTSTELWGSTGWLRLGRITLDQKLQHCTCMWQVSQHAFGWIQVHFKEDNLFFFRREYPPNTHTHSLIF